LVTGGDLILAAWGPIPRQQGYTPNASGFSRQTKTLKMTSGTGTSKRSSGLPDQGRENNDV